jgi:hypothetical protein
VACEPQAGRARPVARRTPRAIRSTGPCRSGWDRSRGVVLRAGRPLPRTGPVRYHAAVGAFEAEGILARLPDLVNADAGLVRRGQHFSTTFLVAVDDAEYLVHVGAGRLESVERGPFLLRSWSFAVRAPADAWARFWQPVPEPGYHDLFAMKKLGVARLEGDLWPLMAHLRYVKDVLAAPRRAAHPD